MNSENVRSLLRRQFHVPQYAYTEVALNDALFYALTLDSRSTFTKLAEYAVNEGGSLAEDAKEQRIILTVMNISPWSTLTTYGVEGEPSCAMMLFFKGEGEESVTVVLREGAYYGVL